MKLMAFRLFRKIGFLLVFFLLIIRVGAQKDSLNDQYLQEDQVQLAPPVIELSAVLFQNETSISYANAPEFCSLYYSEKNGRHSRWIEAPKNGLKLKKSANLSFIYLGDDRYINSDIIHLEFRKISNQVIDEIELVTEPSDSYPGQGSITLIDQNKGTADFKDGQWLGFNQSVITLGVSLEKKMCLKNLTISSLQNQGAWIFLPQKIEVYHKGKLIGSTEYSKSDLEMESKSVFLDIPLKKVKTSEIEIKIISLEGIPDWHPGKGNIPWFFIDEIILE